jgi:RNA polymerase sigma-70 factor (ECF subfamily)
MSEAKAIEGAKQGDGECFEFLYSRHKRRVYSLCLRMIGNVESAEDLTQEAFLQLYRKVATFRSESAFSTWLHRMTVNVVLMSLRKKGLPEVSLDETLEPTEEGAPKKEIATRDKILAGSIDRLILERAIHGLPPGYRTIFVLHDIEGYEHNEIAGMLGCSVGNTKSQLHKARMKLRDVLRITRAEKSRCNNMKAQPSMLVAPSPPPSRALALPAVQSRHRCPISKPHASNTVHNAVPNTVLYTVHDGFAKALSKPLRSYL